MTTQTSLTLVTADDWRRECIYIDSVMDKGGRVSEMNNDKLTFIRYCEMQQDRAHRAGFHDAAQFIDHILDDLNGTTA